MVTPDEVARIRKWWNGLTEQEKALERPKFQLEDCGWGETLMGFPVKFGVDFAKKGWQDMNITVGYAPAPDGGLLVLEEYQNKIVNRLSGPRVPLFEKVFFENRVTVVLWEDGTRTKSTCSSEDSYDPVIGFGQCVLKKIYGKKKLEKMIKRWKK